MNATVAIARKPQAKRTLAVAAAPADPRVLVSLVFTQMNIQMLHHVRKFVTAFVKAHPGKISAELISDISVTLHELLENAVKHSNGKQAVLEVCTDLLDKRRMLLRTVNHASAQSAARVLELLGRLETTPSGQLYQDLLEETITRSEGSGLGLVRVASECDMALKCTYDGKSLTVEAWSRRSEEGDHVPARRPARRQQGVK